MSLSVPPITSNITQAFVPRAYSVQPLLGPTSTNDTLSGLDVKLDVNRQELIFEDIHVCPLQVGNWIVVNVAGTHLYLERRHI